MKKSGIIAAFAFALIFAANAAALPVVETLEATADGAEISYSGTIEDGSYAVMCKLYQGDEEIDLLSSEVDGGKFSGSFTAPKADDYRVLCANYEGGDIMSADVTTEKGAEDAAKDDVETPSTLDAGILRPIIAIVVAGIVLGFVAFANNRKKK